MGLRNTFTRQREGTSLRVMLLLYTKPITKTRIMLNSMAPLALR